MEFVVEFKLENKRYCSKMNVGFRLLMFFFDIFAILYSIADIEFDSIFIHYCITLFTIFLSIANMLRIECVYSVNCERTFRSIEEYESWKKEHLTNTKYIFFFIENICKISFLFRTIPMEYTNLYTVSILILNISAILFGVMLILSILYSVCVTCSNPNLWNKSKRIIQPIEPIILNEQIAPIDTIIEIQSLNDCSICMEISSNKVIKTNCNHEFHEKCLLEWMKISKTCPICRDGITTISL